MKPGIELDALVAEKVMGIDPLSVNQSGYTYGAPPVDMWIDDTDFPTRAKNALYDNGIKRLSDLTGKGEIDICRIDGVGGETLRKISAIVPFLPIGFIKPYSTDISAAWEVVERLDGTYEPTIERHGPGWTAWFDSASAWAETAPHAICLAALKACGVDIN